MAIDYDVFKTWAEKHFDAKTQGHEVMINSIFTDDTNKKLSCRPDGQTKNGDREHGVYHCWKTDRSGTLVKLVMEVESCSFQEACEILQVDDGMAKVERELEEFFKGKRGTATPDPIPTTIQTLAMPDGVVLIDSLPHWDRNRKDAEYYLGSRKIPTTDLYVGTRGEYRERVVIPYRDKDKNLVYYNGRYFGTFPKAMKYKGPPKEIGVGKGDVVFMPKWVEPRQTLHVTEGEFDAIVLSICGVPSCSVGGSHLTDRQSKILRPYRIKLCGDMDKPGAGAIFRTGTKMIAEGFKNLTFVRPPKGFKDWNEFYVGHSADAVRNWVTGKGKVFDMLTAEQLFAQT